MRRYVHILINNGTFQSRVLKASRTALASGLLDAVHIIAENGRNDSGLPDHETLAPGITLERVPFPNIARGIDTLLWMMRMARRGVAARATIVSVHHVLLLPVGVIVKLFSGAQLVYDAHELETESASLVGSRSKRRLYKVLEWALLRFADQTIVVSEPIRDWYLDRHRAPVTAIHNYPRRALALQKQNDLRTLHDIPDDRTVFIYQGVIEANRGVPLLLEVFEAGMVPDGVLVLMGFGGMSEDVKRAAATSEHVSYQPAVPPDQILSYTASADVGLCVFEAVCQSYALAMPNKLFEYLQAGLPVVVGNPLEAMSGLVRERGLGLTTDLNADALAAALVKMCRSDRTAMITAVEDAAATYTWENEEPRLMRIYDRLDAEYSAAHPTPAPA